MASNSFGTLFRITTWGESHGRAIGVVIDGCPAGLELSEADIAIQLDRRKPGTSALVSPRNEGDSPQILSGVFEGKTTGTPISIVIFNTDADSSKYEPIRDLYRPGHANFTYLAKYGIFDHRGGGRASGRETACRVAAGAVAKKLLAHFGIHTSASLVEIGGLLATEENIASIIAERSSDSVGGIVEGVATGLPKGLGDPIYEKLEANLAKAMLSLPATKGVEFGEGFAAARMRGSEHNDLYFLDENAEVGMETNHSGGILAGISTGAPLKLRVAFKPTASIQKAQKTVSKNKEERVLTLPEGSRHDPCVAIRAVPVIEAMLDLVLADAVLMNRVACL
ncbi:MAG: chorismate synthase [Verrucomicrobia bacterium]|nr:chorismate synthase [Verrucomicrobiota bacterium]